MEPSTVHADPYAHSNLQAATWGNLTLQLSPCTHAGLAGSACTPRQQALVTRD